MKKIKAIYAAIFSNREEISPFRTIHKKIRTKNAANGMDMPGGQENKNKK
ncbi:hypothetical protein [Paenibacillus macerans]|nr:hypothetical protein [Paenibacillus macerans]MBS5912580.1 hypothetical protein [Paenibacillus macerans]